MFFGTKDLGVTYREGCFFRSSKKGLRTTLSEYIKTDWVLILLPKIQGQTGTNVSNHFVQAGPTSETALYLRSVISIGEATAGICRWAITASTLACRCLICLKFSSALLISPVSPRAFILLQQPETKGCWAAEGGEGILNNLIQCWVAKESRVRYDTNKHLKNNRYDTIRREDIAYYVSAHAPGTQSDAKRRVTFIDSRHKLTIEGYRLRI